MKREIGFGFTTVVDSHPRFWSEFVLWTICANRHLNADKRVYFVGETPQSMIAFAAREGIDVRFADTLVPASPHCNKIIPFLDPDGFEDQIVTDSDVYLTGDIAVFFRSDVVRLPPNNHARPPLPVFKKLFAAAGLDCEPEPATALFSGPDGMETYSGNVSAGVIAIPRVHRNFAEQWLRRANWLAGNLELLGGYKFHLDQISFAIAAREQNLPFTHLPAQANAILQLMPEIDSLYAVHLTSGHIPLFPHWFNDDKTLKVELISKKLAPKLAEFNQHVVEAKAQIDKIAELAAFSVNFLNPAYRR